MTITVSGAGRPTPSTGQPQTNQPPFMNQALAMIDQFGQLKNECSESPIFLLAAGWRSGSTLLQRLIVSSGEALIWGEPFGASGMIRGMSEPLRRVPRDLGPKRQLDFYAKDELSNAWIANLYPPMDSLLQAHQNYWNTLLADPARKAGYTRWGLKEVRLDVQQMAYLKWLYPKGIFVFLVRNPYDAYLSYRRQNNVWFETWPDRPLATAQHFGMQWQRLATGYVKYTEYFGALLLKYEELSSGGVDQLAEFLGLKFDNSVLDNKVDGFVQKVPYQPSTAEIEELRQAVNPLAASIGYTEPATRSI